VTSNRFMRWVNALLLVMAMGLSGCQPAQMAQICPSADSDPTNWSRQDFSADCIRSIAERDVLAALERNSH
jgi:hypothetical protein